MSGYRQSSSIKCRGSPQLRVGHRVSYFRRGAIGRRQSAAGACISDPVDSQRVASSASATTASITKGQQLLAAMYEDSWYSFVPELTARKPASTTAASGHRRRESLLQQPNVRGLNVHPPLRGVTCHADIDSRELARSSRPRSH